MEFKDITSPEAIAERVKWLREHLGLQQNEFATSIGMTRTQVNNWERATGRLSLNGAMQINNVYGTSLDFLFLGRADTLPQNMRNAWASRSLDKNSNKSSDNPES
ncbi:helix-turn-helix domain-containing protein [Pseudovibrio denitrificans]|uniref:helix-turn-helix domain-containing protein n=1 Tax=Pseudovibrio denitrificans TaxID=258256 RepID=UPI0039BF9B04